MSSGEHIGSVCRESDTWERSLQELDIQDRPGCRLAVFLMGSGLDRGWSERMLRDFFESVAR